MDTSSNHNEEQIQYFSSRPLPRMTATVGQTTPYVQRQVDAVREAAAITDRDRVLDVGCGPGKYTVALAAAGVDVTGLDLTPALVEQLHAAAPEIPATVGDLMDPPEDLSGSFDVVTGFFMLHHIDDLPAAFRGVRRLLKDGGRAVFCEPNPYFAGYYLQITLTPGMTWRGDGGIVHMRPGLLGRAAADAGLVDFRVERFGAFPPALANRPRGQRVERSLERVPGWQWARAFQLFSMRAP